MSVPGRKKPRVHRGTVKLMYGVPLRLGVTQKMAYAEARCSCGWREETWHGEAALAVLAAHREAGHGR